jgi:hypothetical protein
MKNVIYGIVIVVCLLVAGLVIFRGGSDTSGIGSIPDDEQTWVLCTNKDCKAAYEMGKKQYYTEMEEKAKQSTGMMMMPLLACQTCGQDKVTEAIKCEKCGEVFLKGAARGDFPDKCTKCGHSKTEARWKERTGRQ